MTIFDYSITIKARVVEIYLNGKCYQCDNVRELPANHKIQLDVLNAAHFVRNLVLSCIVSCCTSV